MASDAPFYETRNDSKFKIATSKIIINRVKGKFAELNPEVLIWYPEKIK